MSGIEPKPARQCNALEKGVGKSTDRCTPVPSWCDSVAIDYFGNAIRSLRERIEQRDHMRARVIEQEPDAKWELLEASYHLGQDD